MAERTTILYLHETAAIAGAENSLLLLASRLDRARFLPLFALPCEGPLAAELRAAGVEVLIHDFPRIREFKGVIPAIRGLRKIIRERNVRIVHSNSIRTHVYGYCAARQLRVPVIWHQRNLLGQEKIDPDRLLSFLPSMIICNSSAIARRFYKNGKLPARVRVVHNGVDTELFSPAIPRSQFRQELGIAEDEKVIGVASRFNEHKGHEIFFQAAGIVLREFPRTRFLVAGGAVFPADRERERLLRELVAGMGISERVIFCGYRRDMPQVYAAMDIVVLASGAEACGRVVLESMAEAKTVVATDSGGTPELIRDGIDGLLFAPGDSQALAGRLIRLLSTPGLAQRLGAAARESVEANFSAQRNVRRIEDIYGELSTAESSSVRHRIPLAAILVVRNEAAKVRRCLESLAWCDEIIVIDQSSDDDTAAICRGYTPRVFVVSNKGFCEPDRRDAAARASSDWIFYLDADEVVSAELRDEIRGLLSAGSSMAGYYVARRNLVLGRWIRGSGWYPGYVLRLFDRRRVSFPERIHEDIRVEGSRGYLKNPLLHYTCENLSEYFDKVNRYSSITARQMHEKGVRVTGKNVLYRIVFLPLAYTVQKFIFKAGFRDGMAGLLIAFFTYLTVLLTQAKIMEIQANERR